MKERANAAAMEDPSTIGAAFVGRRSPATYTVEIEGEAVVLDEASDRLHLLNVSATLVWHCLDGTSSLGAICRDVAEEMGIPFEVVLSDTLQVARNLATEGLIRVAGQAAQQST